MNSSSAKSAYFRGLRDGAPFLLVIIPFALLFGVVGTEAGLNIAQVMGFTVLVIAGAAQFTAVQLMVDNTPTLIVLASALAVNLRMAMYSASLTPHLGEAPLWQRALVAYFCVDQSYGCAVQDYEKNPSQPIGHKIAYFFGTVTHIAPMWYGFTYFGAVVGTAIPEEYALDFAVPITFLALVAPALRTLPHVVAAVVSVIAALSLTWVPYNLGLMIAATLAMLAGAQAEAIWGKKA